MACLRPLRAGACVGVRAGRVGAGARSRTDAAARVGAGFETFPSDDARTNCIVVGGEVLRDIRGTRPRDKLDAYGLDSGRRRITRQTEATGLGPIVVARDGSSYEYPQWPRSRTFWQADQDRAVIDDKQTELYRRADAEVRATLAGYAWGREAELASSR